MEFISVEEFLKLNEEIQKVLLEWWENNCSSYDLITFVNDKSPRFYCDLEFWENYEGVIPLLTEGQLRKFIEDKTGGIETIEHFIGIGQYDIKTLPLVDGIYENDIYEDLGEDVLQAYWKVAIEIAKHETR